MDRISKIVSIQEVTDKGLPTINVSDSDDVPGSSSGLPGGSSPSTAPFGSLASSGSPGGSSPSSAPFSSLAPTQPKLPVKAPCEIPFKSPPLPRVLIALPPFKAAPKRKEAPMPPFKAAPKRKEAPTDDVPKQASPPSKAKPKMPGQAWIDDFARWEKERAEAPMFPPLPPLPVRLSPQVPTAPVEHPEPTGTKRLTTNCLCKCSNPQPAHPPSKNLNKPFNCRSY